MRTQTNSMRRLLRIAAFLACALVVHGNREALAQKEENVEALQKQLTDLYQKGKYEQAIPIAKNLLEILERTRGPEHPDTAIGLNNLAMLYRNTGGYAKAELLYQRALKIYEKALGPEHPDTATSLHDLAGLYDDMGDYAKAEPLYQ